MDQFYFEEGYLEASYFSVVREAAAAFSVTASQSAVVDIADATGYYIPDYIVTDYFVSGGQLLEADAALSVTATQTLIVERITQAAATVAVSVAKSCTVTRIIDSAAAFTAAFAPTLTATAFKNHTAVLDSVSTMSVDAQANRSTNVLLEHIADLNAMAAKTVDVTINVSHTATQSTTATRTASPSVSLSSSASLACTLGEVHSAQSQLSLLSSLTTSRYFGKNRPRNVTDLNEIINLFNSGLAGGQGISTGANSPVIFAGPLSDISPGANESWVLTFTYNNDGTTTARSFFYSFLNGSGSERFLRLATTNTAGTGFQLNLFKTGQSTVTQTFTTSGSTTKIAISYHNGYAAVFLNGQRQALIDLTATTGVTWTGFNELIQTRWSLGANTSIDEFHYSRGTFLEYNPQSSTVTATNLQVNSPTTTEVLWHFDGNGLDDISVTESAAAALQSTFTQQTIGSGTFVPRSALASLSSTVTVTAQGNKPASATANLSTTSTLSVIIGSVKDSITLNAGVFSVTAQESRLRDAASSITSAFAPTLNAVATRRGDIALSTVFALTADANSFTDSGAAIASVFGVSATANGIQRQGASAVSSEFNQTTVIGKLQSVTVSITGVFGVSAAVDGIQRTGGSALSSQFNQATIISKIQNVTVSITGVFGMSATANGIQRQGASALSSQFNQTTTIGKLQNVSVPITSAFTTVMNVSYFEGTSLIAPMSAVMSVTAVKTARITQTLASSFTVSAVVNENPQAPAANPITATYQERVDVNLAYTYTYVKSSSTRRSFNFTSDTAVPGGQVGIGALQGSSLFPNGSLSINSASASVDMYVYVYGNAGGGDYYDVYVYSYDLGVVDSINIGASAQGNGSGSIRLLFDAATTGLLTAYLDGSSTPISLASPTTTFKSRIYYPTFQPFGIPNTNGMFGWPPILFPTVNNIITAGGNTNLVLTSVSVTDDAYNLYYGPQEYGQADLIDINFATLTAEPFTVQFGAASAQVLTAISADVSRIRQGVLNLSSTATTAINAGKNVEIGSDLASQSTISVTAVKVTRTSADLNVVAAQSTANDRLRTTTTALATTATISIDAVKRTGIVLSLNTAATQSVTGFRIKQGQASISALYSQLSVAFQNATGTVLLETVSQMQITAEKNAVGVIAITAAFTQSTNSADSKTVRVSSAIAAQATLSAEGLRIQPAGANLSAVVTQSTNTDQSKITRVTAAFVTAVTTTATAARTRSTPTTLSAATAIVCNNVVLRQASANLSAVIYDFTASPQYIIRITATFSAFNSQLTVGEIINIDPALQLMIEPETRIRKIQQETRVLSIESETRVNIIED